jgi:hypothetical protein
MSILSLPRLNPFAGDHNRISFVIDGRVDLCDNLRTLSCVNTFSDNDGGC